MKKLFDFLVENKLTPNGLMALYCIHNNFMYSKTININIELYKLEINKFIEKIEKGYKLTNTGLLLLNNSEKLMMSLKDIKEKSNIKYNDIEDKIKTYNELFPKGKKDGSLSFRTAPKELYQRFIWFFNEYPEYNFEIILKATQKYIEIYSQQNNYTYMQTSKYFIRKVDNNKISTSNLATMCYNIVNNNDDNIDTGIHFFE